MTTRTEFALWGQTRPRARWEEWRSLGTNETRVMQLAKREVDNYRRSYPDARFEIKRRTIVTSDWEPFATIGESTP